MSLDITGKITRWRRVGAPIYTGGNNHMKLGIEPMFDIDNACVCLKEDASTGREWTAIGPLGADGDVTEHIAYCHPSNAPLFTAVPALLEALKDAVACLSEYRETGYMTGWDKPWKDGLAAIAKAEGRT